MLDGLIFINTEYKLILMSKKNVTTEDLARMVSKGFAEMAKESDLIKLKKEVVDLRVETKEGFEHLEKVILSDYKRRIEKLELEMKDLKNALAM
jgi:hypothetical protein